MILEARRRGQPLLALVAILAGWIVARGAVRDEEAPRSEDAQVASATSWPGGVPFVRPVPVSGNGPVADQGQAAAAVSPRLRPPAVSPKLVLPARPSLPIAPRPHVPAVGDFLPAGQAGPPFHATPAGPDFAATRISGAAGHQALWLAATALMPLPPLGLKTPKAGTPLEPGPRWSGDGWLLWRRSNEAITPGPRVGTYGASQAGAVIRYRLDTADARKPSAYLRATTALNRTREQQAALGLSARPLAGVPVVAMAEARVVRDSAGVRVKPALAAVTELPPQALPLGFAGEVYVQGGWIGGERPGGFVDGLARVERPVAEPQNGMALRAGAGVWGAKQRGASRLDIGPVASLTVRLGGTAAARVEADWRFRVGGRSRPDSGPALTVSAGF